MGVELFGLVVIVVLAVGAFLFLTGAFGVASTAKRGGEDEAKPKHAYIEDDTDARIVGGVETADQVRALAEKDPDTDVRT
ncbi:MAG: hypothetical protein H0T15_02690 [Thermoleophilaceae bacterium]|nr:hypothetical protein [Thermoleophilaceae bacterium]